MHQNIHLAIRLKLVSFVSFPSQSCSQLSSFLFACRRHLTSLSWPRGKEQVALCCVCKGRKLQSRMFLSCFSVTSTKGLQIAICTMQERKKKKTVNAPWEKKTATVHKSAVVSSDSLKQGLEIQFSCHRESRAVHNTRWYVSLIWTLVYIARQ